MFEKKQTVFKSPDMSKLQEVIIDMKTKIYIALDADPKQAKKRYMERIQAKPKFQYYTKKGENHFYSLPLLIIHNYLLTIRLSKSGTPILSS